MYGQPRRRIAGASVHVREGVRGTKHGERDTWRNAFDPVERVADMCGPKETRMRGMDICAVHMSLYDPKETRVRGIERCVEAGRCHETNVSWHRDGEHLSVWKD